MESKSAVHAPTLEPRWLDVDTAAQYLCMSRRDRELAGAFLIEHEDAA